VRNADRAVVLHDRATLQCASGPAASAPAAEGRTARAATAAEPDMTPSQRARMRVCLSAPVLTNGSVITDDLSTHSNLPSSDDETRTRQVFRIHVERESLVSVRLVPQTIVALALFDGCGPAAVRVAEDAPTGFVQITRVRTVSARLPPGDYPVVLVDDAPNARSSSYSLSVTTLPIEDPSLRVAPARLRAEARLCVGAMHIVPGNPVHGVLAAGRGLFAPHGCADGRGNEVVYVLHLERSRHLSFTLRSEFPAALYVRSACSDRASDLACHNTASVASQEFTEFDQDFAAGDYEVVVDAAAPSVHGNFVLNVIASGDLVL
jgi:hypothetical protein